jgi:hypothetical protein
MLARYNGKLFPLNKTGSREMNKRGLQIEMALLGAIPVLTGIIGMFGLSDPLYASVGIPANAVLDSNLRFFGGVWLGLGLSLYLLIPNIEKQTLLFRVLWGMISLGGIGRLASTRPKIVQATSSLSRQLP